MTKLYGIDTGDDKRAPLHSFFSEPLFNFLGITSIAFGVFKSWQQKSVRPFLFFGGIGAAIIMIF